MKAGVQYFEGRSRLHRLHPLVKCAWLLVLSVSVFLAPSPWMILGILVLLVIGFRFAGVGLSRLTGIRLILLTAFMLCGLQLVFIRSGEAWFRVWRWSITVDGIVTGLYIGGRFLAIVLLSYLFVLTTHPNELAYAIMRLGVPYRYGYSLITALRMVPMFQIEADTIYKAQLARGVRHDGGGLRRLVETARRLLMPLLVSALGKADTLAVSMEGRCFGMHRRRTYLRRASLRKQDHLSVLVLTAWVIGLVVLRHGWS